MLMNLLVRQIRVCSCAIAIAALLFAGCGKDEPEPVANTPIPAPTATPEAVEQAGQDAEDAGWTTEQIQKMAEEEMAKLKAEQGKATAVPKAQAVQPAAAAPSAAKAKTYKELIVGKWELTENNATVTVEFSSDGTLSVSVKAQERDVTMSGSYKWESSNSLSMTMKMELPDGQTSEQSRTMTVDSLDENSLTMTGDNDTKTLTRVTD